VFHGNATGVAMTPARVLEGAVVDRFGSSVASAGDVDGDGFADLLVGAPGAETASVYHGSATGVAMTPASILEGATDGDGFGTSVASAGDVDGDGFSDLVVGAYWASPGGRDRAGTASVYHGSATGVALTPALVLGGAVSGDCFGFSVASAGDVNGDGFADLVVGANHASPGRRREAGTASVFHGSASGVARTASRVLEGAAAGDLFGGSVASAGDADCDGFADLIVGANHASPGGRSAAGTASVFHGSASGVVMTAVRVLEGDAADDAFGRSVASGGDVDGDGFTDIVVGAWGAERAYVFQGSATGVAMTNVRVLGGVVAANHFGWSVASGGDVTGYGIANLVVMCRQSPPASEAPDAFRAT
jgi:hypothetical protein